MNELTNYFQIQEERFARLEREIEILKGAAIERNTRVNIDEFSQISGLKKTSIYVKKCKGELPPTIGSGRLAWRRSDVENWLHSTQKNGRITNKARV